MQLQTAFTKPITRYTKNGATNIAYQVFGSGTIDIVYIPGWISNIDWMWSCPELTYFLRELGKIARVIVFDKRGTGLSDRAVKIGTLKEHKEDMRAVMDAAGAKKAVLFGHSDGGAISSLFAATYPDRTLSLITFGMFAKRTYAPHYPWAPTNSAHKVLYDTIQNHWGSNKMNLESLAPSKANDPVFMDWLASYYRLGASPAAAMIFTKMKTKIDIIDVLDTIKVPTLLLQRLHDKQVHIEEARFISARIPEAKLVPLEGNDHLFWTGNADQVLEEIKAFVLHTRPKPVYQRQLFTIVVGCMIPSAVHHPGHAEYIRRCVKENHGTIVQLQTETFTAIFEGPSDAVRCSTNVADAMKTLEVQLSIGIHIKECRAAHPIRKEIANFSALVREQTIPGQIVLTQIVKNLLVGFDANFTPYKTVFKDSSGESFLLYSFRKKSRFEVNVNTGGAPRPARYDLFLEKVLEHIDTHIGNEHFCIEMLCKEMGVSQRQLQRKLKATTNLSPNKLIRSMRLHRAKELIGSEPHTIAEIAFKAGFSDPSYFSKCFKDEFAISPSELLIP